VGKTLLAIEATANFAKKYPKGLIWYREAEAAFDEKYAETLGLPVRRVDFGPDGIGTMWDTVEDIFEDLEKQIAVAKKEGVPGIYIVDSLDALSTRPEMARDIDKGSFKTDKAKLLSELFRRQTRKQKEANILLLIISQIRAKIGVMFGEKDTRGGGKALDFYASQALWLSHMANLTKTIDGVKRITAQEVRARCKKNKIAMPFRECTFKIRFGYGIDDLDAAVNWLAEVKQLERLEDIKIGKKENLEDVADRYIKQCGKLDPPEFDRRLKHVNKVLKEAWVDVESKFRPARRKYAESAE
jgi:recombination protein RecA